MTTKDGGKKKTQEVRNRLQGVLYTHSPPCAADTPLFTSGNASFASSLAITRSQFMRISTPPPNAAPLTAAISGLQEVERREMEPKPCTDVRMFSCSFLDPLCWAAFHLHNFARPCPCVRGV